MFGGSLPYAWPFAAVAESYLAGFSERFAAAVRSSEEVFKLLDDDSTLKIERVPDGTNVVKMTADGTDPELIRKRLRESSIDLPAPLPDGSGFKVQINETWQSQSPEQIAEAMRRAAA